MPKFEAKKVTSLNSLDALTEELPPKEAYAHIEGVLLSKELQMNGPMFIMVARSLVSLKKLVDEAEKGTE